MTRGSVRKNFGPCVVCGEENISEEYRKITEYSISKVHKCPTVQSLNFKLQVGDQLCKKHYNELINYNWHDRPNNKQNIDKDTSFHANVNQHKCICLSEKDYWNLCNKAVSIEQLTQRINDLEAELGAYMIEVEKSHNNGNIIIFML